MSATATAVDWLLESDEPGIVFQAKRDLLGEQSLRILRAAGRRLETGTVPECLRNAAFTTSSRQVCRG